MDAMSPGQNPRGATTALHSGAPGHSRLFSTTLLAATVTSVLSTLCFIAYLVVRVVAGASQQTHFDVLYRIGIVALVVTEGCQIVGVLILLRRLFSRHAVQRQPGEVVKLILSLFPYCFALLFLISLIVYLRARQQDPTSARTHAAAKSLRKETVNTLYDIGADQVQSTAGGQAASPAPASPSMRDAVRRVIGPSTAENVSQAASGLLAIGAVALVLSAVATVTVVPAVGFAPLTSGTGSAGAPSAIAGAPSAIAGTWALTLFNCTSLTGANICSDAPGGGSYSVVFSQTGNHVTLNDGSTPLPTGTISGHNFTVTSYDPISTCTSTYSGTVLASDRMRGTFDFGCNGPDVKNPGTVRWDWTATRTA